MPSEENDNSLFEYL